MTLRRLADLIREKGAFEAMVAGAGEAKAEWFLADSRMLTQPRSAYLLRFMENAVAQQAVQRVRDLQDMLRRMDQQKRNLNVFKGVLEERLDGGVTAMADVSSSFEQRFDATVRRLSGLRDSAEPGSKHAGDIKQLALTLSDLRQSADRFSARAENRGQRLRKLSGRIDGALATLGRNRQQVEGVLSKANAELDQRVLTYVEGEAGRMIVALEKAEQQIAHLYEYLALQSLERGAP